MYKAAQCGVHQAPYDEVAFIIISVLLIRVLFASDRRFASIALDSDDTVVNFRFLFDKSANADSPKLKMDMDFVTAHLSVERETNFVCKIYFINLFTMHFINIYIPLNIVTTMYCGCKYV